MAIESMPQLLQHAKNHEAIAGQCAVIVTLWARYYEKSSHYRDVAVSSWDLQTTGEEPQVYVSYRAWDRKQLGYRQSWFPARYLFMPIADVEVDIKKRRREYDQEIRRERKAREREDQEKRDARIEQEYAKLLERRAKKHKKRSQQ